MTRQSGRDVLARREFLEHSMLSAASAALAAGGLSRGARAAEAVTSGSKSPGDKLGVAIVGMGERGAKTHLPILLKRDDVEILWLVDPDEERGQKAVEKAKEKQGRAPQFTRDMLQAFDDPAVDVVTVATPHHWHSLAAIWAMQHGKDVYVEKPVSHNVSEGRRCVEVARKYDKICQTGTQCRTHPGMREAIEFLRDGQMGKVKLARGLCYKRRKEIGPRGMYKPPAAVDYSMWLGPAPEVQLSREPEHHFHYDWHWQWPYGNGDLGNQGVHQMDIARWGLGLDRLPDAVFSYGGRVGQEPDAGDTPNTQVVMLDYGDQTLTFEVRGLETGAFPKTAARVGVIFEGEDGRKMVVPTYYSAVVFDRDMKPIKTFGEGQAEDVASHFANFFDAVRSRKVGDLTADILEGHLSSALCHLGNVSYELGQPQTVAAIEKNLPAIGGAAMQETFLRTRDHLDENEVNPATLLQLGALLQFDPAREEFKDHSEANRRLTRDYRPPFVVPTADKI